MSKFKSLLVISLISTTLLPACQPSAQAAVPLVEAAQDILPDIIEPAIEATAESPATPTPQDQSSEFETNPIVATPLPDPFDDLPTPEPRPVTIWRPPIYDVPLARNDNDHFYFTRPIATDKINWPNIEYRYGAINFGPNLPHTGIDLIVPVSTPVYAAGPGKVTFTGVGLYRGDPDAVTEDPYGIAIVIRHNFGYENRGLQTVYAHLSGVVVQSGEEVEAGQLIGYSGRTGLVTGPHLHFEVRINIEGEFYSVMNPELWLAPPQGWGVLVGRLTLNGTDYMMGHEVRVISKSTSQEWFINTYGTNQGINTDPVYLENLVLSDIPAGKYYLKLDHGGETWRYDFEIFPGATTYFKFSGISGFTSTLPYSQPPSNIP
ncbi:MAG: M23 family peptidase [Chloroflexi bacterium]|nr:MAG: M23 family peptidase [Chloroflexota bacterium]MBL1196548.1 M23 family metallopeptidase [Chloroflexota bacterium]NOH13843.1 peptidoglycan DD-metalloendopeptidase family protein [Chloroflexota bacterium]